MTKEFDKFLNSRHLASLAVCKTAAPWAFNAFYAYDAVNSVLLIASDENTTHGQILQENPKIAGTIALDTKVVNLIKGVQFEGEISAANSDESEIYFAKFPFARAGNPKIWKIVINSAKLTDNKILFGKKLKWQRNGGI